MSYEDLYNQRINQIDGALKFLTGNGQSQPTLEISVNFSKELNAVKNATSSGTIIQLTNALYDQVAFKRSITEIYKTAKDYYTEYQSFLNNIKKNLDFMQKDVSNNHELVLENLESSKIFKKSANVFQKKISLINP